jgi:septal ring factor EnvC (AmiA/AmiB activator)
MKKLGLYLVMIIALSSCVTKKKFQATQTEKEKIEMALRQTTSDLAECEKKFGQNQAHMKHLQQSWKKQKQKLMN